MLRTARFTLRPIRREDTAALYPSFAEPAQLRYMSHAPFTSPDELEAWLLDPEWPGRTWIAEDAAGEVAARFVAVPGHEDGVVEVGYFTLLHRQGEGVARECMAALVHHLIRTEGARKLTAEVDAGNAASIRLIESLGFTREAHLREHETTHAGLCDVLLYGLLAREYPAK